MPDHSLWGSQQMSGPADRHLIFMALLAASCLALSGKSANAQSATKNAAAGQALAERYCVECHMVVPSAKGSWTNAPAFVDVANRPGATAAKLSSFIQKPHMHMLNTGRPSREADQISDYIMSLRKN